MLIPRSLQQEPEAQTNWELDSSRGWIKRQLWRTDELAGWGHWSHLRQVVLVRILRSPGPQHGQAPVQGPVQLLEERFHVTNLVRGRLNGARLIQLDRAHWRVENDCHGALDIQWKEDHGRFVRRGNGLPVMALLRVLAYNLLSLLRVVHLRSHEGRTARWQQLRDWVRDALVWPSLADDEPEATPATP